MKVVTLHVSLQRPDSWEWVKGNEAYVKQYAKELAEAPKKYKKWLDDLIELGIVPPEIADMDSPPSEIAQMMDSVTFAKLAAKGLDYKITGFKETSTLPTEEIAEALQKMGFKGVRAVDQGLLTGSAEDFPEVAQCHSVNHRLDVHIPGNSLSTYNQVTWLEDACTEALQTHLEDGWRIIACCPQPDQRRPDYVLGRYNPNQLAKDNATMR